MAMVRATGMLSRPTRHPASLGGGPSGPTSTPREMARFLVDLKPILGSATDARRTWVRRIGILMEDARKGNPAILAAAAGSIGREYTPTFRSARDRIDRITAPKGALECHRTLSRWLDKLVQSGELLIEVGSSGNVNRIREIQELLAEGRAHAVRFNEEYLRLISNLGARVAELSSRRRENALRPTCKPPTNPG